MNTPEPRQSLPISLIIVAAFFILGGISAVIEVVLQMMSDHLSINFGVLGIFIGIGLLRLRRGWRTCALVFTWFGLIITPIIGVLFLYHSGPLDFILFGRKVGHVSKQLGLALVAGSFVYSIWQYRVLTSRGVRALFIGHPDDISHSEIQSKLFAKFLSLHPELQLVDSRLQWNAFHRWINDPKRDDAV